MLTREMIYKLNTTLTQVGVGFVYQYVESDLGPYAKVMIKDNGQDWIENSVINLTSKYYNWLENWFWNVYKMKLTYNNTKSSFWAN